MKEFCKRHQIYQCAICRDQGGWEFSLGFAMGFMTSVIIWLVGNLRI